MIVLNGLGDRGIPSFGGKTPLEVAQTPNMDSLASAGQCGLVDPLFPGMPVSTHSGFCPLFGLSRKQTLQLAREASDVEFNCQSVEPHPLNQKHKQQMLPPANGLLRHSPGKPLKTESLISHLKLKAAVISGERTVLGLATLLGYKLFENSRFTGALDTDLHTKAATALAALKHHDLVYLHINAPATTSHKMNPNSKREILLRIDNAITPLINDELIIGITADHSTDSNTGRNTGDPVPSLIYNPCGRIDQCKEFNESACGRGGLGRISSFGFLLTFLDQMSRLEDFTPKDGSYIF